MDEYGNTVHRNRWSIAAAAGIVAFLLFWLSIGWSFLGGLIAGLVVFGILLVVIGLIGADAPAGGTGEAPRSGGDRTVTPSVPAGGGGAVAAAASTAAVGRSDEGTTGASDKTVEDERAGDRGTDDRLADDRLANDRRPEAVPGAMASGPGGEADASTAGVGAAALDGDGGDEPVMAKAANPPAGERTSGDPASDEPFVDGPVPDGSTLGGMPRDDLPRDAGTVPPATADDADATTDDDPETGDVATGGDTSSKPRTLSAPRDGQPDDLRQIRGVGPKLAELCNSLGFWHFDQIADWSEAEIDWVDTHLEGFKGRVRRDDWVAQARTLASGEATEFSTRVDRGGV